MKNHISTLMDGELCDEEAESLLGKIKLNAEAHQDWVAFHLIGDVLRQPDYIHNDLSAAFAERLRAEPTILAPHSRRKDKVSVFAMSAVASIMAMALLAWLSMQMDPVQPKQQLAQQNSNLLSGAGNAVNEGMNDYLLAHHEYSPSTDMRGASSYIHTVALRYSVTEK
jgi:sigma-E factor negative regulatory protein RseA